MFEQIIIQDEWLDACGKGHFKGQPFQVIRKDTFGHVNRHFSTMYEVKQPDGYMWVVAVCRVSHSLI